MVKPLSKSFVKKLLDKLFLVYQDDKLKDFEKDYFFYITEKNKIFISNFDIDKVDIDKERISVFGLYFGTLSDAGDFRFSFEGSRMIESKSNYILLKEDFEVLSKYLAGNDLSLDDDILEVKKSKEKFPFFIVKFRDENLGSVSIKEDRILNFVPKSKRVEQSKLF